MSELKPCPFCGGEEIVGTSFGVDGSEYQCQSCGAAVGTDMWNQRADGWMSTKKLAALFHNTYEELAPSFGYETRADTKELDFDSPNGKLMLAVCERITTTGE
ncbi:Lar family restriction alleviation protein [bacterium]|nr:Lar family restriction alleviation protein [bacterium]